MLNWEVIITHCRAWSQKWNVALGVYIEGHVKNLIAENLCLQCYNAMWVGECFPKYCRNACNHSPSGTISYPKRCESPDTTARNSNMQFVQYNPCQTQIQIHFSQNESFVTLTLVFLSPSWQMTGSIPTRAWSLPSQPFTVRLLSVSLTFSATHQSYNVIMGS
jgi:hypothetical protein